MTIIMYTHTVWSQLHLAMRFRFFCHIYYCSNLKSHLLLTHAPDHEILL